jgi:hypothetical protein
MKQIAGQNWTPKPMAGLTEAEQAIQMLWFCEMYTDEQLKRRLEYFQMMSGFYADGLEAQKFYELWISVIKSVLNITLQPIPDLTVALREPAAVPKAIPNEPVSGPRFS